jgi:hypothetical protein
MKKEEKDSLNYRFGGYQPPLVQIGGNTDAGYWLKFYTHPYYQNQPHCWKQPTYLRTSVKHFGTVRSQDTLDAEAQRQTQQPNLYPFMDVCKK